MIDMTNKTDAFRTNIRRELKLRKMTQGELAKNANLSQEWLSEMLCGHSNPTLPVCERIAAALDTSLEALIAERTTSSVSSET